MLDPFGIARVGEATCYALQQSDLAVRRAQQKRTTLDTGLLPVELGHYAPRKCA